MINYNHKQIYTVNNEDYIAEAYFLNNMLYIKDTTKTLYQCSLDSYTNFEGNMESFVNKVINLKIKGLSQSKITEKIKESN